MSIDVKELIIAVLAIGTIGVGLWMYAPWMCFVGVGSLVLALTVAGRVLRA